MSYVIEPVSPASSSFAPIKYIIENISPAISPISDVTTITPKSQIEFTSEWFEQSSKAWRRGKIFLRKKQMFYYATNADSPFTFENYKTNTNTYPNANLWSQCGYIDSNGNKCIEQGIFYDDEIKSNKEYDYEKFTDVHLCEKHNKYKKKETRKRYLHTECIMLEKIIKKKKESS